MFLILRISTIETTKEIVRDNHLSLKKTTMSSTEWYRCENGLLVFLEIT